MKETKPTTKLQFSSSGRVSIHANSHKCRKCTFKRKWIIIEFGNDTHRHKISFLNHAHSLRSLSRNDKIEKYFFFASPSSGPIGEKRKK